MNVNNFFVVFICLLYSFLDLSSAVSKKCFAKEVLDAHNHYRARHNVPPLQLNDKLSKLACDWAKYLLAHNRMEHRPNNQFGENIYMASGGNLAGTDAVRMWYNEIEDYNWQYPTFQMMSGHFTQVVWKNSRKLGVGFAKYGDTIFVVCNYDPPGNYMNQFQQNVLPPK